MVDLVERLQHDDIVVDIRHPDDVQKKPLALEQTTLQIPYFNIKQLIPQLDSEQRYLLYCDHAMMSRIQAELMAEQGIDNVHVLTLR